MPPRQDRRNGIPKAQNVAGDVLVQAAERLRSDACFCRYQGQLDVRLHDGRLVIAGRLPSFYLKQLLQEKLKSLPVGIVNQVEVVHQPLFQPRR